MGGTLLGTDARHRELAQVESRLPHFRVDVDGLAVALQGAPQGEVRFTGGGRARNATDASNYRRTPIGLGKKPHTNNPSH